MSVNIDRVTGVYMPVSVRIAHLSSGPLNRDGKMLTVRANVDMQDNHAVAYFLNTPDAELWSSLVAVDFLSRHAQYLVELMKNKIYDENGHLDY